MEDVFEHLMGEGVLSDEELPVYDYKKKYTNNNCLLLSNWLIEDCIYISIVNNAGSFFIGISIRGVNKVASAKNTLLIFKRKTGNLSVALTVEPHIFLTNIIQDINL